MPVKKVLIVSLLLALSMALLVSCENRADLAKKQITPAKIKPLLVNREVRGADDYKFKIVYPGYVELIDVTQQEDKAAAVIHFKALELESRAGAEGELKLHYAFSSGEWQLQDIEPRSLQELNSDYAERLVQLIEFPLHFAANIGDISRVKQLLHEKTDVNSPEQGKESTAVMFASERGFIEVVKLLTANGANVNHHNRNGLTALHAAAYGNHPAVVKHLIDQGAEITAVDKDGRTALHFAARRDALEVVEFLASLGADLNARSNKHWTPIFEAAERNALDVAKFLVGQGVDMNVSTEDGNYSPLLSASYYNSVEMVALLLDAGAATTSRLSGFHSGEQEFTALQLAEKRGNSDIIELLKKHNSR